MEPTFTLPMALGKAGKYRHFITDYKPFIEGENNIISAMANTAAALREAFGFFWVGFYIVTDDSTLSVGPFQGGVACSRIRRGRGVCGTAWAEGHTIIVPDVDSFPGHIACSSASRSEIVVPLINGTGQCLGVLDIDSDKPDDFDTTDQQGLEEVCRLMVAAIEA